MTSRKLQLHRNETSHGLPRRSRKGGVHCIIYFNHRGGVDDRSSCIIEYRHEVHFEFIWSYENRHLYGYFSTQRRRHDDLLLRLFIVFKGKESIHHFLLSDNAVSIPVQLIELVYVADVAELVNCEGTVIIVVNLLKLPVYLS